jgi:hypothetical protein
MIVGHSVRTAFRKLYIAIPLAGALACGTDAAGPQATASLEAATAASQNATVGAAVPAAPAVRALSAGGAPVAGAKVTFAVVSGGGTLGTTSATTGADGIASAGSWTLGTAAGVNAVDATVAGLPAVRFAATGRAGAATALSVAAGDGQTAAVGAAVATAPAVKLEDRYGNPVGGAAVTFAVESGNGTLAGATTTSGADGVARLGGWTLGIAAGAQRIKATSGALSASINATASVPAGCTVVNYALGATLPMNWESDDCVSTTSGRRYDRLQFTTTKQEQIEALVTGPAGRILQLRKGDLYVGLQPGTAFSPPAQNPMHLKYVLAPGTYEFQSFAPDSTTRGAYTFATTTGTKIDCDYIVFASTNVKINGTVDATSCAGPGGGREQWINLQLKTGMKVRITLSGTDNVPFLVFRDDRLGPASPTLATARGTTAGESVSVTWTATFDTWHEIIVTSLSGLLGKYTLEIEELP